METIREGGFLYFGEYLLREFLPRRFLNEVSVPIFVIMSPVGIFDSGIGGLTVLREIKNALPQYDYMYLGDNARAPYGNRSFETVYAYTKECVKWMMDKGCPLIILACNTASAKALRTIQQKDLPRWNPAQRVLGVIRPTAEVIGNYSGTGNIGILATRGTVQSESYLIEIRKFFPGIRITQHACPLWVPIIENNEAHSPGAFYFIEKDVRELLAKDEKTDTILLGCTHYPLIKDILQKIISPEIKIIGQGEIVAESLKQYLQRHPEIETKCSRSGKVDFFTTDDPSDFNHHSELFFGETVQSVHVSVESSHK